MWRYNNIIGVGLALSVLFTRTLATQIPIQIENHSSDRTSSNHGPSTADKDTFLDDLISKMTIEDLGA